jgi:putative phosphoribosyl transferase
MLESEADRVICLETPDPFIAVGAHYRNFGEVTDDDVVRLLNR